MNDAPRIPQAPPDAPRWAKITELVGEALDRDRAARAALLATVEPPSLASEVAALVEAHEAAESTGAFLSPFEPDAPETPLPEAGTRLGPYRITGRLGAGGMGAVYSARRDGLDRDVALKVVRHASPALAQRFAREQRALARLEHPHIARLYDVGLADEGPLGGTPYLAMERVEGEPITAFCEARQLGVDGCLRLMVQVCEAVAYAHGRLVLHRDLKPSNVLVAEAGAGTAASATGTSGGPRAVVLDFGIAKLLGDDPEAEAVTHTGGRALTPAYAAPEQVAGGEVTTAADVYGLGALLYEVLSGQRPHAVEGLGAAALEAAKSTVPPPPSAVASTARARALTGDLDTICLKALAPEADQRYASAEALADDLRRYEAGLPVTARRATFAYRLRRYAQRHRAVATGAAVAALALTAGVGAALWQGREAAHARDRAEARFEVAREAARAMLYDVHDAVAGLPGSTVARETIVDRSLDYLQRLDAEADDDPALRIDLAGAYLRIGTVQGSPTDNNLGRADEARASYRRGLALLAELPPGLPDSLAAAASGVAGRLWEKTGVVVAHTVAPDSALADLDRAIAAQRRALAFAPDDVDRRAYLATSHINRADYTGHPYFPNAGQPDSARAHYGRAYDLLASIPEADQTLFSLRMLGITYERVGTMLRHEGRLDESVEPTREALRLREQIARRRDANTDAYRDVGVSHEALAFLLAETDRLDGALAEFTEAQEIYDALLAADAESVNAQQTVATGHLNLARFLSSEGAPLRRRADARRYATEAADRLGALAEQMPGNQYVRSLAEEATALRARL